MKEQAMKMIGSLLAVGIIGMTITGEMSPVIVVVMVVSESEIRGGSFDAVSMIQRATVSSASC